MNHWNELIAIRDKNKDDKIKNKANLLLRQLNTAGAIHLIKNEVESFINNYKRTN